MPLRDLTDFPHDKRLTQWCAEIRARHLGDFAAAVDGRFALDKCWRTPLDRPVAVKMLTGLLESFGVKGDKSAVAAMLDVLGADELGRSTKLWAPTNVSPAALALASKKLSVTAVFTPRPAELANAVREAAKLLRRAANTCDQLLDMVRKADAVLLAFDYERWREPYLTPDFRPLLSKMLELHEIYGDASDAFDWARSNAFSDAIERGKADLLPELIEGADGETPKADRGRAMTEEAALMGEKTGIAWTDSTFNGWIGCTNVSPGCDHCYAEALSARFKLTEWGPHGERKRTSSSTWRKPIQWQKGAAAWRREHGRRRRVFCASMADVFDNQVPPAWRADLFALIKQCPDLDWQVLTKRPQNMAKMLPPDWGDGYPNVWLGTTTESQDYYDQRWPALTRTPAVVRFVSYEPALGPLRLPAGSTPDWLICGSESGPGARPCDLEWVRSIRDQCADSGVVFFWKQHVENGRKTELPTLDGRIWADFPRSATQ